MNIKSFMQLTRFEHSIMIVLAVIIGQIIALGHLPGLDIAILASIPPFFICLASFAVNDVFDIETDRKNKRMDRPLVNGSVKESEAYMLSIGLFIAGILVSFLLTPECYFIAGVFAAVAFAYSLKLKDIALVGNLYIAATMAIPFIYGSYSVGPEPGQAVIILALIAFVAGVAREIAGDVRDMEGDAKARRSRTLPMIAGRKNALAVHSILYVLAVLLSFYPYLYLGKFAGNLGYLVPIVITDLLILFSAISVLFDSSSASLKRSRNVTLAALGTGLLGFLLGAI